MSYAMPDAEREMVATTLAGFPEVRWDRMLRWDGGAEAYGWIARDDGRSDFLLLHFAFGDAPTVAMTTSSARYSEEFFRRLYGTLDGHVTCERIEDVLDREVGGANA